MQTMILRAYDLIFKFVKQLNVFFQIRWVRIGLQILTLIFCTFYLYTNLKEYNELPNKAQFNFIRFGLSWVTTIMAVFCGATAWWLILRSLFQPTQGWTSIQSHTQSNLAKYIPGFAWQILGKAYLTRQTGVPTGLVGYGLALEMGTVLMVGSCLVVLFYPYDLLPEFFKYPISLMAYLTIKFLLASLLFLATLFLPGYFEKFLKTEKLTIQSAKYLRFAAVVLLFSWLIFGFGYWLLGSAFQTLPLITIPRFIFALSASVILGLLAIFAPGGIGVRESIMVFILSPTIGGPLAVILAASSRVLILLSEIIAYLTVETFLKFKKRG